MKNNTLISFILLLVFAFSCNQDSELESITLKWTPSEFSMHGSTFFSFRTGDDGSLYSTGFVNGQYGVHKAENSNWVTIAKLEWPKFNAQDFTVFKQHIYLITSDGTRRSLWKVKGSSIEMIEYGDQIVEVENFNRKLIISGDFSEGIAYSEDVTSFVPIAPDEGKLTTPGYEIVKANNMIYVRSSDDHNVYEYDGVKLAKTGYRLGFDLIDSQGFFYVISGLANDTHQIEKWVDDKFERIGPSFNKEHDIRSIFIKDDVLIATGINSITNNSITFFFDGTKWKEVESEANFFGAFEFNGKVFAYSIDGVIEELVFE